MLFVATFRFVWCNFGWPANHLASGQSEFANENETEIHCSQTPRAPRVIPQTHTQRGHSTRLIRNPKWKQLIKVGGSRAGQGADKAITHCALHAHTHTHTPRRPHGALSIRIRLVRNAVQSKPSDLATIANKWVDEAKPSGQVSKSVVATRNQLNLNYAPNTF